MSSLKSTNPEKGIQNTGHMNQKEQMIWTKTVPEILLYPVPKFVGLRVISIYDIPSIIGTTDDLPVSTGF